jgi:hypothetical protein
MGRGLGENVAMRGDSAGAGGAMDCRRGEDPTFVFTGDLPRGGGSNGFLDRLGFRALMVSVGSGAEPAFKRN